MNRNECYATLGLSSGASSEEVKKAYRKLAKEHHPDKEGGDEETFKKISEAYSTLKNPEATQKPFHRDHVSDFINNLGFGFGGFGFNAPRKKEREKPVGDDDITIRINLPLSHIKKSATSKAKVVKKKECLTCSGIGGESNNECDSCEGTGMLVNMRQTEMGMNIQQSPCGRCHSTGRIVVSPCKVCNGKGLTTYEEEVIIRVTAEVVDGKQE